MSDSAIGKRIRTEKHAWQQQPDATCNQVAAQNTWVTILPTTEDVRIYMMHFVCTVANETLEYELTIDGTTRVGSIAAVFGTDYFAFLAYAFGLGANNLGIQAIRYNAASNTFIEGHSVGIRMRKTTANGASALQSLVTWAKLL